MNRAEMRRWTILSDRVRKAATSTKSYTVELEADDVDRLLRFDDRVELFKDYPSAVRRRMARAGQALPDGSFPIADCADAANAIHAIGRAEASKRARVVTHIRKRVHALGCKGTIYENYK